MTRLLYVFDQPEEGRDVLWRADPHWTVGVNEFGDPLPASFEGIRLTWYPVVRRTPAGAWISEGPWSAERDRWVGLGRRKRYACETAKEALTSLLTRRRRQIRVLNAQIERAEREMGAVREMLERGGLDDLG